MDKKYTIRQEKEQDYAQIYDLIKTAFETAEVKDGDEQDFANNLRIGEKYIPELALLAEKDGKPIGHIMLTKIYITKPDKSKHEVLMLAPLAVLLEYRNIGVGSSLVHESVRLAKEMGYNSIFLCGDPNYYARFGFQRSDIWNIRNVNEIPDQYVMGLELIADALKNINGDLNFYQTQCEDVSP